MPNQSLTTLIIAVAGAFGFLAHKYPKLYTDIIYWVVTILMFVVFILAAFYSFGYQNGVSAVHQWIPFADSEKAKASAEAGDIKIGVLWIYFMVAFGYLYILSLLAAYWMAEKSSEETPPPGPEDG